MKIYLLGNNQNKTGGGWSFIDSFTKGDWEIVDDPNDCEIYFITSVSMMDKVSQIPFNKKVVLRIDNVLRNSTNRKLYGLEGEDKITRMEAMKQIAQKADAVVFQSQWAKDYLTPFLGACGGVQRVILNGSDDELFNPKGSKLPSDYRPIYLYIRSSNHDNKGWHIAWYEYQQIKKKEPDSILWIVGRFSPENIENNFDFFNGENWKYWGYVKDKEQMAMMMRSADCLLYPFWMDCCSQTLIETFLSNLKIRILTGGDSGGSKELIKKYQQVGKDFFSYRRMNWQYKQLFEEII